MFDKASVAFTVIFFSFISGYCMGNPQNSVRDTSARADKKNEAAKVTFVELGSVNCIPCKAMQPVMKEVEKDYGDQVKVVFHDVWTKEGQPYAKQYKIMAIPTQVFLDKFGKEFHRHTGFYSKKEIIKVLKTQGVE